MDDLQNFQIKPRDDAVIIVQGGGNMIKETGVSREKRAESWGSGGGGGMASA
jgi:hypothetical protein